MVADFEADYYEWKVGDDERTWNTKDLTLRFGLIPYYTPVDIQLKVYKSTSSACFPNANDTAVFKRTLITVPYDSSKIYGKYQGFVDSKPNEPNFFQIETYKRSDGRNLYTVQGISRNCSINPSWGLEDYAIGYRSFYVSSLGTKLGCCHGLSAFGIVKDQELTLKYGSYPESQDSCQWSVRNDPYNNNRFTGRK